MGRGISKPFTSTAGGPAGITPPSITTATATVNYLVANNTALWYASGTITLPGTLTHVKKLTVQASCATANSLDIATFTGAQITGGSLTYQSLWQTRPTGANQTWTITINDVSEDGTIGTPWTTTVTVVGLTLSGITGADVPASRFQDPATALHVVNNLTVVSSSYPMPITLWTTSPSYGTIWHGWFILTSSGQVFPIGAQNTNTALYAPMADESWTASVAIGCVNATTTIPGGALTSPGYLVNAATTPLSTAATGAYVDSISYSVANGSNLWGWPHIYATLPLASAEFWCAQLTMQTGAGVGGSFVPGGAHPTETIIAQWVKGAPETPNMFQVGSSNQIYNVNGNTWPIPTDTNTTHRFKWYVTARRGGLAGTSTQQTCWSSGIGVSTPGTNSYQDVVVDSTKGQSNAGNIDPTTLGPGLYAQSGTGRPTVGNASNPANMLQNWSFEEGAAYGVAGAPVPGWIVASNTQQWVGFDHSGNGSLKLWGSYGNCSQTFSVAPGQTYYFEVWCIDYNSGSGYDGTFAASVQFLNAAGGSIGYQSIGNATSAAQGAWQQLKATLTAPALAATMVVYAAIVNGATNSWWFLDDCVCRLQTSTGQGMTPDGNGGVKMVAGVGLGFDGSGNAIVKVTGALYTDISGNVNLSASSDFLTSGGTLSQIAVNLAKSYGFDTTIFGGGGGSTPLTVAGLTVAKLLVGDALFVGQATFASSGGGKLTLNSTGLTIADNRTSPTATLTLASGSATFQNGSLNSLVATASGVTIQDNTGAFVTVASGGILIQKGSNYVNVTAGGVTIVGGSLTSPSISGGSLTITTLSSVIVSVTPGQSGLWVYVSGGSSTSIGPALITLWNGSTSSIFGGGPGSGILSLNGVTCIDSSWRWTGREIYCPSYSVTCSSLIVSGVTAINTFGQWAGYGVNCPSYNVTCSAVVCASVSSTGSVTASIHNVTGGYFGQDVTGGLVCGSRTLYFKGGILYAWS
jgi:hypothetical protein